MQLTSAAVSASVNIGVPSPLRTMRWPTGLPAFGPGSSCHPPYR